MNNFKVTTKLSHWKNLNTDICRPAKDLFCNVNTIEANKLWNWRPHNCVIKGYKQQTLRTSFPFQLLLMEPTFQIVTGRRSFRYVAAKTWNSLPETSKTIGTLESFRLRWKRVLLRYSYCTCNKLIWISLFPHPRISSCIWRLTICIYFFANTNWRLVVIQSTTTVTLRSLSTDRRTTIDLPATRER